MNRWAATDGILFVSASSLQKLLGSKGDDGLKETFISTISTNTTTTIFDEIQSLSSTQIDLFLQHLFPNDDKNNGIQHYCVGLSATPYAASMVNFRQVMRLICNQDLIVLEDCKTVDKFVTDYAHDSLFTSNEDLRFLLEQCTLVKNQLEINQTQDTDLQDTEIQDTEMQDSELQEWKERAEFFIAMQQSEADKDRLEYYKGWLTKRSTKQLIEELKQVQAALNDRLHQNNKYEERRKEVEEILKEIHVRISGNTFFCSQKPILNARQTDIEDVTFVVNHSPADLMLIAETCTELSGKEFKKYTKKVQRAATKFMFNPHLVYQDAATFRKLADNTKNSVLLKEKAQALKRAKNRVCFSCKLSLKEPDNLEACSGCKHYFCFNCAGVPEAELVENNTKFANSMCGTCISKEKANESMEQETENEIDLISQSVESEVMALGGACNGDDELDLRNPVDWKLYLETVKLESYKISPTVFPFPKTCAKIRSSEVRNNRSIWLIIDEIISRILDLGHKALILSDSAMGLSAWYDLLPEHKVDRIFLAVGGHKWKNIEVLNHFKTKAKFGVLFTSNGTGGVGSNFDDVKHIILIGQSTIAADSTQAESRCIRFTRSIGNKVYIYRIIPNGPEPMDRIYRYRAAREWVLNHLLGNTSFDLDKKVNTYKENVQTQYVEDTSKLGEHSVVSSVLHAVSEREKEYNVVRSVYKRDYYVQRDTESSDSLADKGYNTASAVEVLSEYMTNLSECTDISQQLLVEMEKKDKKKMENRETRLAKKRSKSQSSSSSSSATKKVRR